MFSTLVQYAPWLCLILECLINLIPKKKKKSNKNLGPTYKYQETAEKKW